VLSIRAASPPRSIELGAGYHATADGGVGAEVLQVRSAGGELLLEFDPRTARARICGKEGGVEVVAGEGDLQFTSGQAIRFSSAGPSSCPAWPAFA